MDALKILEDKLEFENAALVDMENTTVGDRVQARLDELAAQIEVEETEKRDTEIHEQKLTIKTIKCLIDEIQAAQNSEDATEAPVEE